ncbi:hypothetical protein NN561_000071 [Cricetulus griseus]
MLFPPPARPAEGGKGGGGKRKRYPPDPACFPTPIPELHAPSCPALGPNSVTGFAAASLRPPPPQSPPSPPTSSSARGTRVRSPRGRGAKHALAALRRRDPPHPHRDYISQRALRPRCGQLTGLVIPCEPGREGGPRGCC